MHHTIYIYIYPNTYIMNITSLPYRIVIRAHHYCLASFTWSWWGGQRPVAVVGVVFSPSPATKPKKSHRSIFSFWMILDLDSWWSCMILYDLVWSCHLLGVEGVSNKCPIFDLPHSMQYVHNHLEPRLSIQLNDCRRKKKIQSLGDRFQHCELCKILQ